jgi:hypothetical protein
MAWLTLANGSGTIDRVVFVNGDIAISDGHAL